MRITVNLQDDVAARYQREADARDQPLESVVEGRITRATELDPRQRYVILVGETLRRVEQALGRLPIATAATLADKVERIAAIEFGVHKIELTPGQLEELAWRARKQGRTIDEMIGIAYEKFAEDFFTLLPGRG